VPAWASGRPSRVVLVVSSAADLIASGITHHAVTATVRGKSSNAKQGARQGQALSHMMAVQINLCDCVATATSAVLDGADLNADAQIRRC
jgi:hypothetical protein